MSLYIKSRQGPRQQPSVVADANAVVVVAVVAVVILVVAVVIVGSNYSSNKQLQKLQELCVVDDDGVSSTDQTRLTYETAPAKTTPI